MNRAGCGLLAAAVCALSLATPARGNLGFPVLAGIVRRAPDTLCIALPESALGVVPGPARLRSLADSLQPGMAPPSPEITRRAPWRSDESRPLGLTADYNRVDQVALGGVLRPNRPDPFFPSLELRTHYSMGRGLVLYALRVEQLIAHGPSAWLGVELHRTTATTDANLVSDAENALSAVLWRQDYRDYLASRGASVWLRVRPRDWLQGRLIYGAQVLDSLRGRSETWSLFGGSRDFRPNPGFEQGTLRRLQLELRASDRAELQAPRSGADIWLDADGAGGFLKGDYDFTRLRLEMRWTRKLAPGLWLNQRGAMGSIASGAAPFPYRFHLGGVGTLRGFDYKQFSGDRFYLYNVEYASNLGQHVPGLERDDVLRGLELVLFTDLGRAWMSGAPGPAGEAGPAWSAGVGLQTSGDGFHLYASQTLQGADSALRLSFRLARSF